MAPPNRPTKTKYRPCKITTQTLLDFDLEESSSDSDFRIEDHDQESDDDFSDNSKTADSGKDGDDDDDDDGSDDSDSDDNSSEGFSDLKATLAEKSGKKTSGTGLKEALEGAKKLNLKDTVLSKPICCACLGDRSDDTNEIVECDGCGVSVHEGCYGVSESTSVSSTVSSCSTEPWFCEACKAGVLEPTCELCPNTGGIFKETDVGRWVHLICALYVPGVAFGEVDQLTSVTLFEMPYSKWGAKTCSLCEDAKFARTGVCIGCDAGMCKTYFHVTCAQSAGFLSEAHSEEADHADPFYAHCKVHSDKTMIKHRKRNFNTLKLNMEQKKLVKTTNKEDKPSAEQLRIQRKLTKHQNKYRTNKVLKSEPWVPTQKMPRLLTTSATACKRLMLKAKLMGVDTAALEFQEAQMAALADVRKKWHIPPAFSVEFIGYYLDRISRLKNLKSSLERNAGLNKTLLEEQQTVRDEYDKVMKIHTDTTAKHNNLKELIAELHKQVLSLCPTKTLPEVANIGMPAVVQSPQPNTPSARPMSVPTAAALKMGVGFPLKNLPGTIDDSRRILSTQRSGNNDLVHDCGICKRCNDQHMLAKCDTCKFYYHLGCLNPPLTRHPKKSKLYGWQCSECDKSDDSDTVVPLPKGPRKSRTRFSKDGTIVPVDPNLSASSTDGNSYRASDYSSDKQKYAEKQQSVSKGNQTSAEMYVDGEASKSASESTSTAKLQTAKMTKKQSSTSNKSEMNVGSVSPSKKEESKIGMKGTSKDGKLKSSSDNDRVQSPRSPRIQSPKASRIQSPKAARIQSPKAARIRSPRPITSPTKSQSEKDPLSLDDADTKRESKQKSAKKSKKDKVDQQSQNINGKDEESTDEAVPEFIDATHLNLDDTLNDGKSINECGAADQSHRHNRKRRKEKHKNKYSSDNEKSPTKEHKRKRKKKSYDFESASCAIPKIRIKFKTLPLPGEIAPEPQCFYVSADMVRPKDTSRPTSVETIDDSTTNADDLKHFSPSLDKHMSLAPVIKKLPHGIGQSFSEGSIILQKPARIASPRKSGGSKRNSIGNAGGDGGTLICDVCSSEGTQQNLVKCDECLKNYHFTCLDPPLKKTPKRRGYSWHCADCDPTDIESSDVGFK